MARILCPLTLRLKSTSSNVLCLCLELSSVLPLFINVYPPLSSSGLQVLF
jgi:hypothetical protein